MHVQLSSFYIVYIYHYYGMSYISCHAIIMSHISCIYHCYQFIIYILLLYIKLIIYIIYILYIIYNIYYIYILHIYYIYIYIYNTVEKIKCSDNS